MLIVLIDFHKTFVDNRMGFAHYKAETQLSSLVFMTETYMKNNFT